MYNEKTRKLTSLMLMTVMVAGGMTFAIPGVMPAASAADDELYVSAQAVGNFAGIQVIEIVIDDSDRSDTGDTEGRPNVEIAGNDVYMAQATDGSWYAYVANQIAIDDYTNYNLIYNADLASQLTLDLFDSQAEAVYANATDFLAGYKAINLVYNNDDVAEINWPFIQSYDISEGDDVTITYGAGGTSESVDIKYEYDEDKDILLDRQQYPENAFIQISSDDSLLNLSPVADEAWVFYANKTTAYVFENGTSTQVDWAKIGFEEGPIVVSNYDALDENVFTYTNSTILDTHFEAGDDSNGEAIILKTSNSDDNLFVNYDNSDETGLIVVQNGESNIEYNSKHSVIFDSFNGAIQFDGPSIEEWLSGVEIELILTDEDRNLNSRNDESIDILLGEVPYIEIGSPLTIDSSSVSITNSTDDVISSDADSLTGTKTIALTIVEETNGYIVVNATWPSTTYLTSIDAGFVFPYVNYDFSAFGGPSGTFFAGNSTGYDNVSGDADLSTDDSDVTVYSDGDKASFRFTVDTVTAGSPVSGQAYFDLFFFGQLGDIASTDTSNFGDIQDNIDRVNDAFYRFALEETDDNTAKFNGQLEYIMINQLNIFDQDTYDSIDAADDSIIIIVNDDMDGADAVTVSYEDTKSTNAIETISVQEDANTHTGTVELNSKSYSSGNTVEITLIDVDLNTDSDTIQTYDVDSSNEWVGDESVWLGQLKINDELFDNGLSSSNECSADPDKGDVKLSDMSFTLTETGDETGIFVGTFRLPSHYCVSGNLETTNGLDLEFEYQDYSDASGEPNESTESASIQSNTGSVTLDSTVYPVPFDNLQFKLHGVSATDTSASNALGEGTVIVTIAVNDPDLNLASSGEDTMSVDNVSIVVARGSDVQTLWSFDDPTTTTVDEFKDLLSLDGRTLVETDPESGIFEIDVEIPYNELYAFGNDPNKDELKSIIQGDIITVTYTDDNDAGGDSNTITDSATFDLRNGVLQTDKTEYVIGQDVIVTLIEPDLNLDTDNAETWDLGLINWDSDAGDYPLSYDLFDANPAGLRETGDNTGIFQVVIEVPKVLDESLERGESITLEYEDNGPAGADYIGDDDEDISVEIKTSNFGSSITLDQKVYTWTDKIFVTVVSPDHNFDSNSIDEIGNTDDNEINISTREDELEQYKLVETGPNTGIFVGEIILTGISHDADGDGDPSDTSVDLVTGGPTNGKLPASDDDGLSISFETSDGEVTVSSALIRWNIGEVQWLEASYPASGGGVVRVIDPDMNWNPESVDSFDVTVWSDSSAGGISLSVTETNEATGIFEGTVFFTTTQGSSGSRLNVNEGDSVTAEYEDNTLPDPYSRSDELGITAVANIGTIVPPLERAPIGNLQAVDAFGNSLDTVQVDQQIQIEADIANKQDRDQKFAYLVQIQDNNGVTVSLSWIGGNLTPEQELSSSVSWIPELVGEYTVTAFAWESIANPTALSPPVKTTITVN